MACNDVQMTFCQLWLWITYYALLIVIENSGVLGIFSEKVMLKNSYPFLQIIDYSRVKSQDVKNHNLFYIVLKIYIHMSVIIYNSYITLMAARQENPIS